VAYSPDGRLLVSGSTNGWVRVWSSAERRLLQELPAHQTMVYFLGFSVDGKRLLSVDAGWPVTVAAAKAICWDVQTWQPIRSFDLGQINYLYGTALSPDGRQLLIGQYYGLIQWWNAETGTLLAATPAPRDQPVAALAFSPDGTRVASGGEEGSVALWDASSFKLIATFKGHIGSGGSAAFSPDGRRLATGGGGGRDAVKLWDPVTHRELVTLRGESFAFYSAAFSPDGNWLAACNWQGQLHLWHAPAIQEIDSAAGRGK